MPGGLKGPVGAAGGRRRRRRRRWEGGRELGGGGGGAEIALAGLKALNIEVMYEQGLD
jgi:hypothetical protein